MSMAGRSWSERRGTAMQTRSIRRQQEEKRAMKKSRTKSANNWEWEEASRHQHSRKRTGKFETERAENASMPLWHKSTQNKQTVFALPSSLIQTTDLARHTSATKKLRCEWLEYQRSREAVGEVMHSEQNDQSRNTWQQDRQLQSSLKPSPHLEALLESQKESPNTKEKRSRATIAKQGEHRSTDHRWWLVNFVDLQHWQHEHGRNRNATRAESCDDADDKRFGFGLGLDFIHRKANNQKREQKKRTGRNRWTGRKMIWDSTVCFSCYHSDSTRPGQTAKREVQRCDKSEKNSKQKRSKQGHKRKRGRKVQWWRKDADAQEEDTTRNHQRNENKPEHLCLWLSTEFGFTVCHCQNGWKGCKRKARNKKEMKRRKRIT